MRKRKTLSNFIPPLYSNARIGQIVTSEPKETTGQPEEGASEMKHVIKLGGKEINLDKEVRKTIDEMVAKEHASMNMPTDTTTLPVLPELHTNDLLRSKSGALWRVYRVAHPKRDMYSEPTYRLSKIDTIMIKGRSEFTGEELAENGMELYKEDA